MDTTLISIIAAAVGGLIGYFLKYYLEKRKEYSSEIYKERRENYQTFVNLFIDVLDGSKKIPEKRLRTEMYDFYKKSVVYASPEVIHAYSNFFQHSYKMAEESSKNDGLNTLQYLTGIIKAMRKDLGLSNKSLGKHGEILWKPLLRDYDNMKEK